MFRSHAPRPDTHPLMSQRTQGSLLVSRFCHLTAEKASLPLHVHFSVIIKAENLFLRLLAISLNLFLSRGTISGLPKQTAKVVPKFLYVLPLATPSVHPANHGRTPVAATSHGVSAFTPS